MACQKQTLMQGGLTGEESDVEGHQDDLVDAGWDWLQVAPLKADAGMARA